MDRDYYSEVLPDWFPGNIQHWNSIAGVLQCPPTVRKLHNKTLAKQGFRGRSRGFRNSGKQLQPLQALCRRSRLFKKNESIKDGFPNKFLIKFCAYVCVCAHIVVNYILVACSPCHHNIRIPLYCQSLIISSSAPDV